MHLEKFDWEEMLAAAWKAEQRRCAAHIAHRFSRLWSNALCCSLPLHSTHEDIPTPAWLKDQPLISVGNWDSMPIFRRRVGGESLLSWRKTISPGSIPKRPCAN